jgi:transposase
MVRRGDESKRQFWRDLLQQFATSGQSVRAFCDSRRLSPSLFYWWRRTLARGDTAVGSRGQLSTPPAFLPVRLTREAAGMEILLGGGRLIRLRGPVNGPALAEVVKALESVAAGSAPC